MTAGYCVNVTAHVLAAMVWLGGMLFFGIVGAPVLRALKPPELRQQLFQQLGMRFRAIGWIAIAVQDFALGPRAAREIAGSARGVELGRRAAVFARCILGTTAQEPRHL